MDMVVFPLYFGISNALTIVNLRSKYFSRIFHFSKPPLIRLHNLISILIKHYSAPDRWDLLPKELQNKTIKTNKEAVLDTVA